MTQHIYGPGNLGDWWVHSQGAAPPRGSVGSPGPLSQTVEWVPRAGGSWYTAQASFPQRRGHVPAFLSGDTVWGAQMEAGGQGWAYPLVPGGSLPSTEGGIGCRASGNRQCPLITLCFHPGSPGKADSPTLQMASPCLFISSPLETSGPFIDFVIATRYLPLCGKINQLRGNRGGR